MGEEQKDALTLACEELCDLTFGNCDTCPIFREDVNGCELMLNAGEPG